MTSESAWLPFYQAKTQLFVLLAKQIILLEDNDAPLALKTFFDAPNNVRLPQTVRAIVSVRPDARKEVVALYDKMISIYGNTCDQLNLPKKHHRNFPVLIEGDVEEIRINTSVAQKSILPQGALTWEFETIEEANEALKDIPKALCPAVESVEKPAIVIAADDIRHWAGCNIRLRITSGTRRLVRYRFAGKSAAEPPIRWGLVVLLDSEPPVYHALKQAPRPTRIELHRREITIPGLKGVRIFEEPDNDPSAADLLAEAAEVLEKHFEEGC